MHFFVKVLISALVIAGVSELAKRSGPFAAILASLPLTSILAMIWLFQDTRDAQKVIALSQDIFWAVLPSLLFFLIFPYFLKSGMSFVKALLLSTLLMAGGYALFGFVLKGMGRFSS